MGSWEHFEHGADVGVRGIGATLEEAFVQAARALFSLVAEDLDAVRPSREILLSCEAADVEALLFEFLSELISVADAKRVVFSRFEVAISQEDSRWHLHGVARGEPYDPSKHEATVEPKGATYTALKVAQESGRWIAQCVVDV